MANYNDQADQARAIWDALDSMVTQDPEAYKKFITEQLQEGRKMMEKQQQKSGESSIPEATLFDKAFGKMSLGHGQGTTPKGCPVGPTAGAGNGQGDGNKKKLSKEAGAGDATGNTSPSESNLNLLDDEIGNKSILAQIVKNRGGSTAAGEDLDEDPKITLIEASEKKKVLIEEI